MRIRASLLAIGAAVAAAAAVAPGSAQGTSDLRQALQSGAVGERYDGYLGFAESGAQSLRNQVGAVNIRRRSLYISVAQRRNVTLQVVAIATGCQLLARVGVGQSYMLADGVWRRRAAGEPPPRPAHCRDN